MKTLLLISALTMLSSVAHAHGRLSADFPKVQFGSVFIPVNEVCVSGDHVKSIYPVSVCVEWKGSDANPCSREVRKILSTPIDYQKEVPVGEGGWQTLDFSIPLDYQIPYGHWTEAGLQVVKTVPFSIPGCE